MRSLPFSAVVVSLALLSCAFFLVGCGGTPPAENGGNEPVAAASDSTADPEPPAEEVQPAEPDEAVTVDELPIEVLAEPDAVAPEPPMSGDLGAFGAPVEPEPVDVAPAVQEATGDEVAMAEPSEPEGTTVEPAATADTTAAAPAGPSLDEQLAALVIPPPWMESVTTSYDTSLPWKDARLEIRRLFSLGRPETHRVGMKLMWIYHTKDDMGDHHEYPMYTFLGGEFVWSVKAHLEYLAQPHDNPPFHAFMPLAGLYIQFGEFERAKGVLDQAGQQLPDPPWRIMRQADLMRAYGDLYSAWGNTDEAKRCYAEAAKLYPTAKPPYGGHTLPRRAADCQAKLDLLTFQSLASTSLKDGTYRDRALGYAGDINLTVKIVGGRIDDIQLTHEEKIDQGACVLIPQRIIEQQSLSVDGVSGATVTKDAIVTGVYRCLKQAGLK